jgi:hypothetical protein
MVTSFKQFQKGDSASHASLVQPSKSNKGTLLVGMAFLESNIQQMELEPIEQVAALIQGKCFVLINSFQII